MRYEFNSVIFDDVVLKPHEDSNDWSQICQECLDENNFDKMACYIDYDMGSGICGVEGCQNESNHYIDFYESELKELV